MNLFEQLKAPFDPKKISWRVGATNARSQGGTPTKGIALAYIDARDVQDRLDAVLGEENWSDSYEETPTGRLICTLMIRIGGPDQDPHWVGKSDGAGKTDVEGDKGGISDAFKRAAVKWGVGRYLYDVDSPWVEVEGTAKTAKIKPNMMPRLQKLLPKPGSKTASKPFQAEKESKPHSVPQVARDEGLVEHSPIPAEPEPEDPTTGPEFDGPYYQDRKNGSRPGFLEICHVEKGRVGPRCYYALLEEHGKTKANQVDKLDRRLQYVIVQRLREMPNLRTKEGFKATYPLQLKWARNTGDADFVAQVMGTVKALGESPTDDQVQQAADHIEILITTKEAMD